MTFLKPERVFTKRLSPELNLQLVAAIRETLINSRSVIPEQTGIQEPLRLNAGACPSWRHSRAYL